MKTLPAAPKPKNKPSPRPSPAKPKVPTLKQLVAENKHFQFLENGKIKCILTGHELAATVEAFEAYLKSKSYKRGIEKQYDISEYDEILINHKDNSKFLYCQLTGAKIPKKKSAIEKHVAGRRFQNLLEELKNYEDQEVNDFDPEAIPDIEEQEDEEEVPKLVPASAKPKKNGKKIEKQDKGEKKKKNKQK